MNLAVLLRNLNHFTCFPARSVQNLKQSCSLVQPVRWKADDRRALVASMPIKDMGTQGERGADIDFMGRGWVK